VKPGLEMGMAHDMKLDLLDQGAALTPSETALLANEPDSDTLGIIKKIREGSEPWPT